MALRVNCKLVVDAVGDVKLVPIRTDVLRNGELADIKS